jgi:Spy/CpxP family protein refolding chaperone
MDTFPKFRFIRPTGLSMVVALAFMVILFPARTAHAQFGEAAGIGEAMQQDFLSRDIVLFSQGLNLDDTQRVIIEALFTDYEQAFDAGIERMKAKLEGMKDQMTSDDTARVLKLVFAPFTEWGIEKGKLYEQFLQNVQVVLTPEQMQKWPAFERSLYREKNISRGQLSGESLNLFYVLRDMKLDDKTAASIQPVVDEYDIALDQALRARQNAKIDPNNPMLAALAEQDSQKRNDSLMRLLAYQIRIREVNDEYIEKIAAALPPDLAITFKADALDRAYPRVFRETQAQRIFRVAKELEGLDPTVLNSVIELETAYLAELSVVNQQLHDALRKHEPEEIRQRAEDFDRRMGGQQPEQREDPTRELFARRDDLARRYIKQLQALLSPEMFDQLPGAQRWIEEVQPSVESAGQIMELSGSSPTSKGNAKGDKDARERGAQDTTESGSKRPG